MTIPTNHRNDPRQSGPQPPFPEREQAAPGQEHAMQTQPDHGEASYQGHGRLRNRIALITGGDSGIGRAVALAFAREGADVGIAHVAEERDARESAKSVEQAGRRAGIYAGDLASRETAKRLIEAHVKDFGRIDVLVCNAAFQGKEIEKFEEFDAERVERTFAVNIVSMFHLVREALPHMREGACIITTASVQAYHPSPGILDYATTKGAIVTFTKGLAHSLIERGIRVNCVAPGPVWTPLIAQSFDEEKLKNFGKAYPMQRPAQPAELAPAYVFLASDESRYVTGEVLGVTGGKPLG